MRDPAAASAQSLEAIPRAEDTHLIIEKLDATVRTDALDMVERLKTEHSITSLDVVIAAAGVSKHHGLAHEVDVQEVAEHFETNALGPLLLFQATKPLLNAAAGGGGGGGGAVDADAGADAGRRPKFVAISSMVSSITDTGSFGLPNTPYGSSKAALNFIMRKIHYENAGLVALTLHPG